MKAIKRMSLASVLVTALFMNSSFVFASSVATTAPTVSEAQADVNHEYLNRMLQDKGMPNTSVTLGVDVNGKQATLSYDENGNPSKVTVGTGDAQTVAQFLGSSDYANTIGQTGTLSNSDSRSEEEKENDYRNKNFHLASVMWGMMEVGTKSCKAAGSEYTPTLVNWWKAIVGTGQSAVDGGGSCTPMAYPNCQNGCGPCAATPTEPAHESTWVYTGMGQDGGCKIGYRMNPEYDTQGRMVKFTCHSIIAQSDDVVLGYVTAEKERDALLRSRIAIINKKGEDLIRETAAGNPTKKDDLQVESINLQIESVKASIDSISGEGGFTLDNNQEQAKKNARIPAREALYLASAKAISENSKDNLKNVETYRTLLNGITESSAIAAKACARKKKVQECTTDSSGAETCVEKEVADPVPGSCDMASKWLPMYQKGPVADYATIYILSKVPSIELNDRMGRLEEMMKEMVASFPRGTAEYPWSAPLDPNPKLMQDQRKSVGALCPSTAVSPADYDRSTFENIAPAGNDPLLEMGRYGLGVNLNKNEYQFLNERFNAIKKEGNLTDAQAKVELWKWMAEAPRSKYYIEHGTAQPKDQWPKEEQDYHASLVAKYGTEPTPCTTSSCASYAGERLADFPTGSLGAEKLSDSARDFLVTFGISGSAADAATSTFVHNWNLTDLVIGQPGQRGTYFTLTQKLVSDLLKADQVKLAELEAQKTKLVDYLAKVKEAIANGGKSGSGTNVASGGGGVTSRIGGNTVANVGGGNYEGVSASGSSNQNAIPNNSRDANGSSGNDTGSTSASMSTGLIGTQKVSAAAGISANLMGRGTGTAGRIGVLSPNAQAIAQKYADTTAANNRKIKQLSSSNKKQPSMASDISKNAESFEKAIASSNNSFLSSPAAAEVGRGLAGEFNTGSTSALATTAGSTTTVKDLGYVKDNSSGYSSGSGYSGSYSSGNSGKSSGTYASNASSQYAKGKGDSRAPASMALPSYSAGSRKKVDSLELFENISGAYKRVSTKRLGVDQ